MDSGERAWLLAHLNDQVATLSRIVAEAEGHAGPAERLAAIRDQVFVIKETLGTLEVPHALASRDEWSRAIDSSDERA